MATAPETITETAEPAAESDLAQSMYGEPETPANDTRPESETPDEPQKGEQPAEDEEGEQPAKPEAEPIAPPVSWGKDYKEKFAALPRDMQEFVSRREAERDRFVNQKSMEAANTRQTVEAEAIGVLQQLQRNYAEQLEAYAGQYNAPAPDIRLLQSPDPQHQALYYEQDRAYRTATAQREALTQQVSQARQQAEALEEQQQQQIIQQEVQLLTEKVPEWSEPSARAKLLSDLEPIAAELGYSAEAIAQARAADIIALKQAHGWRSDAMKYRELMKRKMEPVRAAKQLPPAARIGAPAGQGQPQDAASLLYPDDIRRR